MHSLAEGFAIEGAFDHLVVLVRDRLDQIAARFAARGLELGQITRHDIGSINRLVVLGSAYIELLGWPAGELPPRPEIASRPIGFDALVFRSTGAASTAERLRDLGFTVTEAQPLRRPTRLDGRQVEARFATVRFIEQPIDGIRMYFCEHLTPAYVWTAESLAHPSGAHSLTSIALSAPEPAACASVIARLCPGASVSLDAATAFVRLPNLELRIVRSTPPATVRITGASLQRSDGSSIELGEPLLRD